MRSIKKLLLIIVTFGLTLTLYACGDKDKSEPVVTGSNYEYISYENIPTVENIDLYHSEVYKNGVNNDDPVENGVVNCPYYTLKINGQAVPIYSTRCAQSVHSFVWIDVYSVVDLELNLELTLENPHKNVVVLPESKGVVATLEDKKVTATLTSLGSYSFAFDKKVNEALTIYVALKEEFTVPDGYEKVEFAPGDYASTDTTFTKGNTVYYFKKGTYNLASIYLPSNSILYFESGSYVNVITESSSDYNAAIRSVNAENIQIKGRALFDFSRSQGGNGKFKGVYNFTNVSNFLYSGITTINSNSWSVCFTNSDNVIVEYNMLLGYRTFSDGIMMSDCQDSIVRYNYVRTGDDAVEVKSTGSEGTENMLYEYNDVWTDKARAYGCIYEANNDVNDVIFRNNSVGFALATWSDDIGCCIVIMGDRKTTTWKNIYFENIEVYMTYHALINITLEDSLNNGRNGGIAKDIYFKNISAYRCYGLAINIYVQSNSTLGRVYLDNINYNNKRLTDTDLGNEAENLIINENTKWSVSSNVKIDSLLDE